MITVILNCYKRLNYLEEQIQAIENQTVKPADIWVWYNNPEDGSQINLNEKLQGKYKVIQSNHNFKFFGRFALANLVQTEYVAMFDDDTIPGSNWLENCLNCIKSGNDGILGCAGVILNSEYYSGHTKVGWNGEMSPEAREVDLVGHSWFFNKKHLKYFFMEDPASWENAEDIHFAYMCQKYGKVKSYVPSQTGDLENLGSLKGSLYGNDQHSSFVNSSSNNHQSIRDQVVSQLINSGWRSVINSNFNPHNGFDSSGCGHDHL